MWSNKDLSSYIFLSCIIQSIMQVYIMHFKIGTLVIIFESSIINWNEAQIVTLSQVLTNNWIIHQMCRYLSSNTVFITFLFFTLIGTMRGLFILLCLVQWSVSDVTGPYRLPTKCEGELILWQSNQICRSSRTSSLVLSCLICQSLYCLLLK